VMQWAWGDVFEWLFQAVDQRAWGDVAGMG
jgi:hypothetical protein